MSSPTVKLLGAQYVLGEIESDYSAIDRLEERAAELQLPMNAALWGWGGFRRAERSLEEMAVESGRATIGAAGIAPDEVDALLVCSTRVPGSSEGHGSFMEAILTGIGLGDIAFYGLTLNRCTNFLAAVDLANAFLLSGRYRRVLVVTTDKVDDEAERLAGYALFCDGAASCVLSTDGAGVDGYELLGCANAQDTGSLEWSKELSADLARRVRDDLLSASGIDAAGVAGLTQLNIFKPLVVMKQLQAGYSAKQLYTENIARLGHCYAADPLINLVDRAAAGQVEDGSFHILAASVPGSCFGAMVRKSAG